LNSENGAEHDEEAGEKTPPESRRERSVERGAG
jgi:hypothetical protein